MNGATALNFIAVRVLFHASYSFEDRQRAADAAASSIAIRVSLSQSLL
jgi:hypothetical protein